MLKQMTTTDRARGRANRVPCVSASEVWRTATQLMRQYPEAPWLLAARRAEEAYAAGLLSKFRLWARVSAALVELQRERTSSDLVN
jgi:hypothetical protein